MSYYLHKKFKKIAKIEPESEREKKRIKRRRTGDGPEISEPKEEKPVESQRFNFRSIGLNDVGSKEEKCLSPPLSPKLQNEPNRKETSKAELSSEGTPVKTDLDENENEEGLRRRKEEEAILPRLVGKLAKNATGPMDLSITRKESKPECQFCGKTFLKSSQLQLHINIHYLERPFRCDPCGVSFRTRGHLIKHRRSSSHDCKVYLTEAWGTANESNPRPFKCLDCKIAFRIHGHLAKHLRSKMHIMRMECIGKLPFGIYFEMEKGGFNLNEIDTTDCSMSLSSLEIIAARIYGDRWREKIQSVDN